MPTTRAAALVIASAGVALSLAAAASTGLFAAADGQDWPTARGNAARTGTSDAVVLGLTAGQFGLAWRRELGVPVSAAPILAGDLVVVADTRGRIHATDLESGWPVWSRELGAPVLAAASRFGDSVLVPCADGTLVACALRDGAEQWRVSLPSGIEAAPAVLGDTAFVVTRGGRLHALDLSAAGQGAPRWSVALGAPAFAPPAVQRGAVVVLPVNGALQCFEASSGKPRWDAQLGQAPCYAAPAIDRGEVVAVSGDGICAAFDLAKGALRYRRALGARVSAAPAVREDRIAIVSEDGTCQVLDREDGTALWQLPQPFSAGPYRAGVVAGADWMFVASTRGRIHMKRMDASWGTRTDVHPMTPDGRTGALRTGPALHPHGFVGVRSDGLLFAYREAAGDGRMLRAALGLPARVTPLGLDRWIDELADPATRAAAALRLCRDGHAAADALARRASDPDVATRTQVRAITLHLAPFLQLSSVIRSHLAASKLARRKLWVACLASGDPDVVRAAVRRWPADADAALLKGFDPSATRAQRRAFVRALPK